MPSMFMTPQTGTQTITINLLPDISKSEAIKRWNLIN